MAVELSWGEVKRLPPKAHLRAFLFMTGKQALAVHGSLSPAAGSSVCLSVLLAFALLWGFASMQDGSRPPSGPVHSLALSYFP